MNAYTGKTVRVDLSRGRITKEALDPQLARAFVGGRGLGSKILYDEINPKVDPLASANKLIFAAGPLTGTSAPTGSRWMAVTKGALTGAVASSNAGGDFGPELKYAGYDMIIVEGVGPVLEWGIRLRKTESQEIEPDRAEYGLTPEESLLHEKRELYIEVTRHETLK